MRLETAGNGITRALISTPLAEAEVYLYGAHVARWTPRGHQPVLFMSSRAVFEPGKPIRGGVPVIFPWFGPRSDGQPGPMHGLVRTQAWNLDSAGERADGAFEMRMSFPALNVTYKVVIGEQLEMELETVNPGTTELSFEDALHTYFAVGDIRQVAITGLEGTEYLDKADGFKRKRQGEEPIRIAGYTDQVHVNTAATCVIEDASMKRRIVVEKSGSASTVVWNPWSEKIVNFTDMAANEWPHMLCVETANAADNKVVLAPGGTHTMRATIRVE